MAITTSTTAVPLVKELYGLILQRGGNPHFLLDFPGQEELFFEHADDDQINFVPLFHKMAFEEFDVLIKIRADENTRALAAVEPQRQARRQKAIFSMLQARCGAGRINPCAG